MAFSQDDIDRLKAAIGMGVKSVAFSDRTIVYHSLKEMMDALLVMESELSTSTDGRSTVGAFSRG